MADPVYAGTQRIIDMEEASTTSSEMNFMVDSQTDGSQRLPIGTLLNSVAEAYSTSKTYAEGDYVLYNGSLYKCISAITTAEPWTAAHWQKVTAGNEISDLKADIEQIEPGLSDTAKTALLNCFAHVAWVDEHGQDYYDALEDALYAQSSHLSAVFTQGTEKYYPFDSLDSLKENLVVTYTNDQGQSSIITNYTLSGTLTVGTSAITVGYNGLTASFNVTVENIVLVNNSPIGRNRAITTDYYASISESISARCRFTIPIKNRGYTISVVDSDKYNIAGYDLENGTLVEYQAWTGEGTQPVTKTGYLMSADAVVPSWKTSWQVTGNYIWCAFKKMDGTDFTASEIENAYGTIFVVGKQSDTIIWNGTEASGYPQQWIDKDAIIGISDPCKLSLVNGYGVRGYIESAGGYPQISEKRATSLAQAITGDFDGKTIGLSSYVLSSGVHIAYGLWYGYINPSNNSFDGTRYVSQGTENVYVFGKWLSDSVTLPSDSTKEGKRVVLLAFKITDADREFTQAELREIPTLIQIS